MVSDEDLVESVRAYRPPPARRRRRLATAESCTAGWIAKVLTDVPGSSDWFDSGYVCYSDAAKKRDLGVPPRRCARRARSASRRCARWPPGALERTGADLALSVSGIAGPDRRGRRQAGRARCGSRSRTGAARRSRPRAREVLQGRPRRRAPQVRAVRAATRACARTTRRSPLIDTGFAPPRAPFRLYSGALSRPLYSA